MTLNNSKLNFALIKEYFVKMEVTVVYCSDQDKFEIFQASYYRQYGEHNCYTYADWLELDTDHKNQLIGKKVMILVTKDNNVKVPDALVLLSRRVFATRGGEFFTLRDATGLSNTVYSPTSDTLNGDDINVEIAMAKQ